jgi:hypothetical protein
MSMSEDDAEEEPANAGLVFHEGMRLTTMKTAQNLSVEYPKLEPLHHIKVELLFHYHKIRTTWTLSHWITLGIGCLAVLLSGWDLGIGELTSGGSYENIGVGPNSQDSGIRNVATASVALAMISMGLWLIFLLRLWSIFPLMRSQAISLFVALMAAQISQYWAHGYDPEFPFGLESFAVAVAGVGIILIAFVGFILQRAVMETRDVHVEERHWHPDPRQMELATRDHSLFAWGTALLVYCILVMFHSWSGAHYVSIRQPGEITGWWIFSLMYILSGFILVWLIIHILWYPQIMLGSGDIRIESDRARQVSKTSTSTSTNSEPVLQGKCPNCSEANSVRILSNGEIETDCMVDGCNSQGVPGAKCSNCGERLSSRVICGACQTSAPAKDYFSDNEAW